MVNEATQNSNKRVQRRREKREIEELNFLTEILTTKKAQGRIISNFIFETNKTKQITFAK